MGPPRSTAASKAATGPSNTSESDTMDTPNAQGELAAAQAEIAQLRAQLAAQATPHSRDQSPDHSQFITVLEALSQRLTRTDPAALAKSAKIPNPLLLTDGKDPTFDSWKL